MAQGLFPVPALFRGDLGEEHGAGAVFFEDDSVASDHEFLGGVDGAGCCEDGDFDFDIGEFCGAERVESGVVERGVSGVGDHVFVEGGDGFDGADAAAEPAMEFEGDERGARAGESGIVCDVFGHDEAAVFQGCGDGLAGELEEGLAFWFAEVIGGCVFGGGEVGIEHGEGGVAHAGVEIAGQVSGGGVGQGRHPAVRLVFEEGQEQGDGDAAADRGSGIPDVFEELLRRACLDAADCPVVQFFEAFLDAVQERQVSERPAVVGEIRAENPGRCIVPEFFAQDRREPAHFPEVEVSADHGHEAGFRAQYGLDEWELDFEGVFGPMRCGGIGDSRRAGEQPAAGLDIHRDFSQRRGESGPGAHTDAVQGDAMARGQDYDAADAGRVAGQQGIAGAGDFAGIDVAGVGDDEGADRPGRDRAPAQAPGAPFHGPGDFRLEPVGGLRVKAAGHGGGAGLFSGEGAHGGFLPLGIRFRPFSRAAGRGPGRLREYITAGFGGEQAEFGNPKITRAGGATGAGAGP